MQFREISSAGISTRCHFLRRPALMTAIAASALTAALVAAPVSALAQDNIVATATLPRDLSPWGMFINADPVVKAVLIGLAFASVVTWTVWLAKTIEIVIAQAARTRSLEHPGARALDDGGRRAARRYAGRGPAVPRRGRRPS